VYSALPTAKYVVVVSDQ